MPTQIIIFYFYRLILPFSMKISNKISKSEYIGLMFLLTYRKPATIILTIAGGIMLLFILSFLAGHKEANSSPITQVFFGVGTLVFLPLSVYISSNKAYKASRVLQEELVYEFTNDKMIITGTGINAERSLDNIYKIREFKNWFLIYENDKAANLIYKKRIPAGELAELRGILQDIPTIELNR